MGKLEKRSRSEAFRSGEARPLAADWPLRGGPKSSLRLEALTSCHKLPRLAVAARGGTVAGITTDGSALSPQPLALVFPGVPHQVCEFHVLKELTKAVLRALAGVRKELAAQAPELPRGRPKNTSRPGARTAVRRGSSGAWRNCSSIATCSPGIT